jgi:tetratricopeptide (TPR) repeat protein
MTRISTALGLVLAAAWAPAVAQYNAPPAAPQQTATQGQATAEKAPEIKPSRAALKAIVELQNAVRAKDFANVPAKLAAAQAVASTKEDRYLIGVFQREAAIAQGDNSALAAATEALANSGVLDATKTSALYLDLGVKQFNAKQFGPSVVAFQRAVTLTPNDPEALELLGQGLAAAGQKTEAVGALQRAIQASLAAGRKPTESLFKRAVSAAYEAQSPAAIELSRQWAGAYPTADSWRNSIAIYRNMTKPDVEGTLVLLRLLQAKGALNSAADYNLFATAAADQSNLVEAQAVIEQGIAAKVVDPSSPLFRETIAALKTKAKMTEADLDVAAKTAVNGMALLRIGDRYYAMGRYAKAVDAYRQALGKPGVDANVANLHIGMALARTGDKAGATAAFNAVTGPRADLAKYWLMYLQQA